MRVVTFSKDKTIGAGILRGDDVLPLSPLGYADTISFITAGRAALDAAKAGLDNRDASLLPLNSVQLLAPIPKPGKILCVGLNYRDHAVESKMELPKVPTIFVKFSSAVIGPDAPIVLPKASTQPDYEAEFAFVIGKHAKNVHRDEWRDYVFGYTIVNDVSARDVQLATTQWNLGKSFDTFAPIGPHIVTADEISDPHVLDIKLSIGGETLQHSNTRHLIFGVGDLVEHISRIIPLEPGDIISTGTPAGVGLGRNPKRWLKPGEEITIEIEKIGTLRNPVIAEA